LSVHQVTFYSVALFLLLPYDDTLWVFPVATYVVYDGRMSNLQYQNSIYRYRISVKEVCYDNK